MSLHLNGPYPYPPSDCSYLPGRLWSADFLAATGDLPMTPATEIRVVGSTFDTPTQRLPQARPPQADPSMPVQHDGLETFERLLAAGFRRSGRLFYRTTCEGCAECVSLRVDVARFSPSGDQRRALKKNRDVCLEIGLPGYTDEKADLYRRFSIARYPEKAEESSSDAYGGFFTEHLGNTREMRYFIDGRLVGLGIVDLTRDAASSVYFFFDPALSSRSLGTYSALREIDLCRQTDRTWLYLGFRVASCRAMTYKSRFRPHQLLHPLHGWIEEADWPSPEDSGSGPTAR